MKKVIYFLFAISLFVFIACEPNTGGGSSSKPDPVPEVTPEPTPTPTPQPQPEPEPEPQPEPEPEPEPPAIITHTIEYVLNGGSWIEDYTAPETYTEGKALTLPDASKITKTDMYLDGWYEDELFVEDAIESISANMKKDLVHYARWVPNHTLSLSNNYTPTVSCSISSSSYSVTARMPSNCKSVTEEIYKYGIYIDDVCVTMIKSGNTYCSYNFTEHTKSLTPGKHTIMVTVEIFDVNGSYSSSYDFTVQ